MPLHGYDPNILHPLYQARYSYIDSNDLIQEDSLFCHFFLLKQHFLSIVYAKLTIIVLRRNVYDRLKNLKAILQIFCRMPSKNNKFLKAF